MTTVNPRHVCQMCHVPKAHDFDQGIDLPTAVGRKLLNGHADFATQLFLCSWTRWNSIFNRLVKGKNLTGNHGFYMCLPLNMGVPIKFPVNQSNEISSISQVVLRFAEQKWFLFKDLSQTHGPWSRLLPPTNSSEAPGGPMDTSLVSWLGGSPWTCLGVCGGYNSPKSIQI